MRLGLCDRAFTHRPKRKDYVWIAYNSRLLREFYAIAGFERFKTQLRVQIDVFLTRINVFLTNLTPFLGDPYVIRTQIARHAQPRTTPRNHVKLAQKSGIVRDPYVILPFGPAHTGPNGRITFGSRTIPDFCASITHLQDLNGSKLCFAYRLTCF